MIRFSSYLACGLFSQEGGAIRKPAHQAGANRHLAARFGSPETLALTLMAAVGPR